MLTAYAVLSYGVDIGSRVTVQGNLATHIGVIEKQREFLWRLGDAYEKGGRLGEAEAQLQALLDMPLSEEQRLEALCFLAEIQVCVCCLDFALRGRR